MAEEPKEEPKEEEPKEEEPKEEEPKEEEEAPKEEPAKKEEAPKEEAKPEPKEEPKEEPKAEEQQSAKEEEVKKDEKAEAPAEEQKKEEKKEEPPQPPPDYELFYWQGFGGRATVIRLCLELCKVKWAEALKDKDKEIMSNGMGVKGANIVGFPTFAYPILRHNKGETENDSIVISQTAIICEYILSENGYGLTDRLQQLYSLQIALTIWDAWSDFAGKINRAIGFDKWITTRIGSYLNVFQEQLKRNGKEGKEGYFFGDKPSVADVFLVDFMRRYRKEKKQHYMESPFKLLRDLVDRFEAIEQIKNYLESEKFKSSINDKKYFIGI